MRKEKYAAYSFRIGSAIGGIVFLYHILMFFFAKDAPNITRFIYMAIFIAGLSYVFVNYRRNIAMRSNVAFGRLMAIGTIVSLMVSLFYALFITVLIYKLDISFVQNIAEKSALMLEKMGMDASIYRNEGMQAMMQAAYPYMMFFWDFIGSVLLSLILSFFVSRTNTPLPENFEDQNN